MPLPHLARPPQRQTRRPVKQQGRPAQATSDWYTSLRCIGRPVTTRIFGKSGITCKKTQSQLCFPSCRFYVFLQHPLSSTAATTGRPGSPGPRSISSPAHRRPRRRAIRPSRRRRMPGGAVAPQAVLEAAVRSLESRRSVSAKIHQQIQLFDKQLVGRGDYLELRGGPVPLIRLEMQVQIGDQVSSLLQVCDGQTLWSYTKLADKETLTRLDAVRATAALQQAAQRPDRNPAAVLPGLGGLSKSLRGWTPISASPPPSGDNSDKRRYGDSRAAGSRPNSPGCCPNRPRPSPRASPPTSDGSPSTSPTASSSS